MTQNIPWEKIRYKHINNLVYHNVKTDKRFVQNNQYNTEQNNILNIFKNFQIKSEGYGSFENPVVNQNHWSVIQSDFDYMVVENLPACYELSQTNFTKGTYRIRYPGYYKLTENIIFNPNTENPDDSFMPSISQRTIQKDENGIDASGPDYPTQESGGYFHMGFFSAITVETDNVIIDLNGYVIQQSELHQLQQRFFAIIETAAAPFIQTPKGSAGPSQFGEIGAPQIAIGNNLMICNGKLGTSSHHGIHGNLSQNILLDNLMIYNHEVAAIHLNGSDNVIIRDIVIPNASNDVRVSAHYSQSRFLIPFLNKLITQDQDNGTTTTLTINGIVKNVETILSELTAAMDIIFNAVRDRVPLTSATELNNDAKIFLLPDEKLDGNRYGIVCGQKGPVVGGFQTSRNSENRNNNIIIHNVMIEHLDSNAQEVLACSTENAQEVNPHNAYGAPRVVDAVGGVVRIRDIVDNEGKYKPNVLSNAQFLLKSAKNNHPDVDWGKINIPDRLYDWVTQDTGNDMHIDSVITGPATNGSLYYIGLGDSMGHHMKGDIGIFLQGGKDCKLYDITMCYFNNMSMMGHEFSDTDSSIPLESYRAVPGKYRGASNMGIGIISCENVSCDRICVSNIYSRTGTSTVILCKGDCKDVVLNDIKSHDIVSGKPSNQGKEPNPLMTVDKILIDVEDTSEITIIS